MWHVFSITSLNYTITSLNRSTKIYPSINFFVTLHLLWGNILIEEAWFTRKKLNYSYVFLQALQRTGFCQRNMAVILKALWISLVEVIHWCHRLPDISKPLLPVIDSSLWHGTNQKRITIILLATRYFIGRRAHPGNLYSVTISQ